MSLVSAVLADVRIEVNDPDSTRFTDATILAIVKQAIRRANRICQRSQLQFAKKSASIPTVANQAYVTMPADLDIPIGLWRDDLHVKIEQKTESNWLETNVVGGTFIWFLNLENSKILLKDTPQSIINMVMYYFPKVDPSAYTTSSTMPWDGRLDDIIARYTALRLQNVDEANTTQDQAILQDMEASIVSVYAPLQPLIIQGGGWM